MCNLGGRGTSSPEGGGMLPGLRFLFRRKYSPFPCYVEALLRAPRGLRPSGVTRKITRLITTVFWTASSQPMAATGGLLRLSTRGTPGKEDRISESTSSSLAFWYSGVSYGES